MHAPVTWAIGFDLDNTLYDQAQHFIPFCSIAAAGMANEAGIPPLAFEHTLVNAWETLGPSHPNLFDFALSQHGCHNPDAVRTLVRLYHECVGPLELYPGVEALLSRLSQRFRLFLITDGNASMQWRKINRLGIAPRFRVIVVSDEHGVAKPHILPFVTALRELQCPPNACLFVGDHPERDIAGAARAGMRTVRVLSGPFSQISGEVEPNYTIACVTEMDKILEC